MVSPASQPRAKHLIDTVERAYDLGGTDTEWLEGVLAVAHRDLDLGHGTYAFTCRVTGERIDVDGVFAARALDPAFARHVEELNADVPVDALRILTRTHCVFDSHETYFGSEHPSVTRFARIAGPSGFADALSLFVQDSEGNAVDLSAPSAAHVVVHPRVRAMWARVGMHLASAWRLRRRMSSGLLVRDALLDAAGKVHDLEEAVRADARARDALIRAATSIDSARGRERASPERALGLWQGLVAGRWSLVDHWEKGGRRFIAAYRNAPEVKDPRALSALERSIVRYVWLGASNKEIAFHLGIPFASVASAVRRLLKKLRCRRREDLVALGDPVGWHVGTIALDHGDLTVAASPRSSSLAGLTAAERDVVERVVAGDSNAAIAERRKTSVNTVANQLQAIYRRLGVRSRTELVRLARAPSARA